MAKIPIPRFNLKAPSSKSATLIILIYRYRGQRLTYSTSINILPKEWDAKTQRPFALERRYDLMNIRQQLDDLANFCRKVYIDSDYGAIKVRNFKRKLNEFTGKTQVVEKRQISLIEFLDEELDEMRRLGMKSNSFRAYKLHAGILKKFIKEKREFDFEDVDWNLRLELVNWLKGRGVQLAYGNKTLSILRQFMERARKKELHDNTRYHGEGWMISRKKAVGQKVILTPEELDRLANLRLFNFADKVRDLFLIGAGTGQRFSDYSRYKPDHFYTTISGIPLLSIISQKTAIPAKIPLNIFSWLLPILEKYDYQSPKISMQKLNEWIKDICLKAKITEKVLKVEQYMGRKPTVKQYYVPKYAEVASHTCRRSFATNLYRMGYKLSQIMPMTGHTTETQLRQYIGIDAEENALEIAMSIEERRKR